MDLIAAYADYQRLLRGWSEPTIRRRTATLRQFERAITPDTLSSATEAQALAFLARYPRPRTRHAYRSDLRTFYSWALRRGHIDHDPLEHVEQVKVPHSLPRPLAPSAARAVTRADGDDMRLMVALALYAGLRCSEIARLDMGDVTDTALIVRGGKGGKDRRVPLHPALVEMLAGRSGRLFDLTPGAVGKRLKRHMVAHGVNATAHQLRHTFGTELAKVSHGDMLMIGALMGHSSATTTLGYTQLVGDLGAAAVSGMFAGDAA